MNRDQGLRLLGLDAGASPREVQRAYRKRSLPLKTQVLTAPRVALKDRYRDDLRALVEARDAALGRPHLPPPPVGVNGNRLLERLRRAHLEPVDRDRARAFLGVPADATDAAVWDAYRVCARALVRRLACATDDTEMALIRRSRMKLRTIRNFAL